MKIFSVLLVMIPTMLLAQSQDTVSITPALPTIKDSISFSLFNYNNCCCSQYYSNAVQVEQAGIIYLSYEVDIDLCQTCRCFLPGSRTTFTSGPLPAGHYEVYKAESPYCPPGNICPAIRIQPLLVGNLTVIEDDTFKIELTGIQCFTLPCSDYRVISTTKRETTLVAGIKNTNGSYQGLLDKNYVPWRDGGYPVLGYFTTDSLAGWMNRATVFVVAQVVGWPASAVKDRPAAQTGPSAFSVHPQPITSSAVIDLPRAGMAFKAYSADGKLVEVRARMEGSKVVWDASGLENGVYFISAEDGNGRLVGKVLVKNR